MNYEDVLLSAKLLSPTDRARLVTELLGRSKDDYLSIRRNQFNNKQGCCPHCGSKKYIRFGKDKSLCRYRCKECLRTFTEYTGTWMDGLWKKELVVDYIQLMMEGKSLDKISAALGINKKTAFDWRHKILSSLEQDSGDDFSGIVESDETFFCESEKGNRSLERPGRKRGSSSSEDKKKKRGISSDKAAVIATADRKGGMNLCLATLGRIRKEDIARSIGNPLGPDTVLCSDGHTSYKGYASENKLEHVTLRADLKQHVKQKVYHIQNVNSIHNRLKKWIDATFWGVSTKYLQNYLGWFRLNEQLKDSSTGLKDFIAQTIRNTDALKRYNYISVAHQWLLTTQ